MGTFKGKTRAKRLTFKAEQKITVLPAAKKEGLRRKGTAPFRRFEDLKRSRTVGQFLKRHPKWMTTIARAVREELVRVR